MKNINNVSEKTDKLILKLLQYNLNYQEASIYVYLLENGMSTVWDISRKMDIPRTTTYRNIAELVKKRFVIETILAKNKKYFALGIEAIERYINNFEQQLNTVKNKACDVNDLIQEICNQGSTNYKVFHYQGVEGLKQVNWNSTKAKDCLRIIEINTLTETVDQVFAENIRKIFGDKGTQILQLTNKKKIDDFTKQTDSLKNWQVRYITPEKLDIKMEILIYNDVTCMYQYTNNNIFIVEIINQTLSDMQKQIFDFYWQNSIAMQTISPYGATQLIENSILSQ